MEAKQRPKWPLKKNCESENDSLGNRKTQQNYLQKMGLAIKGHLRTF